MRKSKKHYSELVSKLRNGIERDIAEARELTGEEFAGKVGIFLEDCLLSPSDAADRTMGSLSLLLYSAEKFAERKHQETPCFPNVFNLSSAVQGFYRQGVSYALDELQEYATELREREPELKAKPGAIYLF